MRTVFVWEGLDAPVQVVLEEPPQQWEDARWPDNEDEQQALLEEAQQGGVDLAKAPAARFVLFRAETSPCHFAWLCHHALLDAWSAELVMGEVERPLFKAVMDYTDGNQSRAAEILGINRATLRKKLRLYQILN